MLTKNFALTCLTLLMVLGCSADHHGAKRTSVAVEPANGTTLNGDDDVNQSQASKDGDKGKDKDDKADPLAPLDGSTSTTPSIPTTPTVTATDPAAIFKSCTTDAPIVAQLYKLPDTTYALPNTAGLTSVGSVCISQFDIASRVFTEGFPGLSTDIVDYFELDSHFKLNVTTAGSYTFFLNSDDGSILTIDGQAIIDNDGRHEVLEKSSVVNLKAGVHDVRLQYFQGPRFRIALELSWIVPGTTEKVYVPGSSMSRP